MPYAEGCKGIISWRLMPRFWIGLSRRTVPATFLRPFGPRCRGASVRSGRLASPRHCCISRGNAPPIGDHDNFCSKLPCSVADRLVHEFPRAGGLGSQRQKRSIQRVAVVAAQRTFPLMAEECATLANSYSLRIIYLRRQIEHRLTDHRRSRLRRLSPLP